MQTIRILVTGGGTGGHVSPALAVVQQLRDWASLPDARFTPEFLYVGSEGGIESKLAREAKLPFAAVATGKLRRSSKGIIGLISIANIRDAFRVPVGIGQAFGTVSSFHPDIVLATGGYVAVPPVIAAGLARIPVLIHEQTATVGLANKIAGRFAQRIALSFRDSLNELPAGLQSKAMITGNPVRTAIFNGDKKRAIARYGFLPEDSELPCVYITGGAQGSHIINRAVEEALPELLKFCRIVHQCGKQADSTDQDFDRLEIIKAGLPESVKYRYHVTSFLDTSVIGDVFALADVVLGRSGAGTVTEVCALGKPALFIPLEPTSGNEQVKNAQRLVDVGAAVILRQADCNRQNIESQLKALLAEPEKLRKMGQTALKLATPNATHDLATALLRLKWPEFTANSR